MYKYNQKTKTISGNYTFVICGSKRGDFCGFVLKQIKDSDHKHLTKRFPIIEPVFGLQSIKFGHLRLQHSSHSILAQLLLHDSYASAITQY
jgi:hypothetical protein